MSGEVDQSKRRFLVGMTTAVGTAGAVGIAVPFVKSMLPSERAQAAGAPVEVDISKLQPGELLTVEWRKKPVWIFKRTEQNLKDLSTLDSKLSDADSETSSQQPAYAKNEYRSREERYDGQLREHVGVDPAQMTLQEKMAVLRSYREEQYEKLVDAVYKRRGWNQNGIPTREKLEELGIDLPEVVAVVEAAN